MYKNNSQHSSYSINHHEFELSCLSKTFESLAVAVVQFRLGV